MLFSYTVLIVMKTVDKMTQITISSQVSQKTAVTYRLWFISFSPQLFFLLGAYTLLTVHISLFLGLFERSHMHYELDRHKDKAGEPSIAEMVEKAIKILQKNPKGYFLLVEGI